MSGKGASASAAHLHRGLKQCLCQSGGVERAECRRCEGKPRCRWRGALQPTRSSQISSNEHGIPYQYPECVDTHLRRSHSGGWREEDRRLSRGLIDERLRQQPWERQIAPAAPLSELLGGQRRHRSAELETLQHPENEALHAAHPPTTHHAARLAAWASTSGTSVASVAAMRWRRARRAPGCNFAGQNSTMRAVHKEDSESLNVNRVNPAWRGVRREYGGAIEMVLAMIATPRCRRC